jgi:hypothetical protein
MSLEAPPGSGSVDKQNLETLIEVKPVLEMPG